MPDLPTLSVTNDQAQRMLAAFGAKDPNKTPQQNYLTWLRWQIIDEVLSYERQQRLVQFSNTDKTAEAAARTALGDDRVVGGST